MFGIKKEQVNLERDGLSRAEMEGAIIGLSAEDAIVVILDLIEGKKGEKLGLGEGLKEAIFFDFTVEGLRMAVVRDIQGNYDLIGLGDGAAMAIEMIAQIKKNRAKEKR